MTPELQKYYEDRFAMMATPGWRDLIDDNTNLAVHTKTGQRTGLRGLAR